MIALFLSYFQMMIALRTRLNAKNKFNTLIESNPELFASLNVRAKHGRPRLEEDHTSLLETIVDIAMHGSS